MRQIDQPSVRLSVCPLRSPTHLSLPVRLPQDRRRLGGLTRGHLFDQRLEMQNPGVLVRLTPSEGWGTGSVPDLSSARVSGTRCPCPLRTPITLDKGTSRHPRLSLPSCTETCLPARSHHTAPGFGFSRRALEGHGASRGALCLSVLSGSIRPPVTCGASAVCYRSGRSMSVYRVSTCHPSLCPPLSVCIRGHLSVCHID